MQELDTARNLLAALQASGITGQEAQFISKKIQDLEKDLSSTEAEAQKLIDQLDNMQARLFVSLHYKIGFQWAEISEIFGLSEDSIKACSYRAIKRACEGRS